jgi:hypothetical protein
MKTDIGSLGTAAETGRKEVREKSSGAKGTVETVKTLTSEFVAMGQRSPNLGLSLQNLGTSYVTMMAQMKATVKALQLKVEGLRTVESPENGGSTVPAVQTFGLSWGAPPTASSGPPGVSKGDFDKLVAKVNEIERELGARATDGPEAGAAVGTGSDVGREVEQILARIKEMESRVSDESIEIDGHVFSSLNDVKLWCEGNDVESCGMFWDLFSALVVMAPKEHTGKEKADETYSSQRTQTTTFENDLSVSMSNLRTSTLYGKNGGQGKLAELEDGFGACSTYNKWVGGSDPYKMGLNRQLRTYLGVGPWHAN